MHIGTDGLRLGLIVHCTCWWFLVTPYHEEKQVNAVARLTEQVNAVARLTKRGLKFKDEKRRPKKKVAAELEWLRRFKKPSRMQQINEESLSIQYEQVTSILFHQALTILMVLLDYIYSMEQQMIRSVNFPR
ncbi:hypothetical protein FRX31_011858 [Thalictrum thalictroides]|uniref:Uncharacterized protein n=1 Tax=Thalictrum thalictroides TaxID=46969 RepID=A0A7J6WNN7_THATH|nr:hypothetical protein FRX31_011858 [Thalictrum thalictroides]